MRGIVFLFFTLLFCAAAAAVQLAPARVVSLDLCTDRMLMLHAPRAQVAALSPGRRSVLSDRLCIAATVQLALDPMAISSVAFQLSYLAMIGIVSIAPRLEAWYPAAPAEGHSGQGRPSIVRILLRLDPFRRIWKAASLAISCQLTTAPLVWLRFGNFPHYFLLTNLLAMPVCELLLPVAILTLVLGSPALMVRATDFLSGLLLEILQIISGL